MSVEPKFRSVSPVNRVNFVGVSCQASFEEQPVYASLISGLTISGRMNKIKVSGLLKVWEPVSVSENGKIRFFFVIRF